MNQIDTSDCDFSSAGYGPVITITVISLMEIALAIFLFVR